MTTTITPTVRTSRMKSDTTASARIAPAHLRRALLAEAKKRGEQLDQPAPALDDDVGQALLAAAQRTLAEVGDALTRWGKGSYGWCLTCGNEIPIARLELRPWATCCVHCATR